MAAGNNEHGWTFDTLYIHVMEISKASKEGVNAAMASAEKAILKAETATEKRFDSVNEFRAAMKDQQAHFADKDQTDFRLTAIDRRLAEISGRSLGINAVGAFIIGTAIVFSAVIAAAAFVMHH